MKKYIITEEQRDDLMWLADRRGAFEVFAGLRDLPEVGEPVTHEFQARDGRWCPFIDAHHYENTVLDGTYPIRALYTLENLK